MRYPEEDTMVGITFLRSKMLRLGASAVLTLVLLCGMA
jgi:hypothetical protein